MKAEQASDPNAGDSLQCPPPHYTSLVKDKQMVVRLLEAAAIPTLIDRFRDTTPPLA